MLENQIAQIPKKYFFMIFGLALVNIFLLLFVLSSYTSGSDQDQYFQTARSFLGHGEPVISRMLKPFMPFFAAVFSRVFGLEFSFIFINSIFYFFIGFVVYKIIKLIFNDDLMALIGTLFYLTAYPMLEYGVSYSTDISGWFFFLVSVYLTILFLKKPSYIILAVNGLITAVGFLAKESGGMGGLFFAICLFFIYKGSFTEKMKHFFVFSFAFLIPFAAWQAYVFMKFNYSYFNWYFNNTRLAGAYIKDFFKIVIKSTIATFLLGWGFVIVGLTKIKRMPLEAKKIILALILPSFSFLLWFAASSRLYYIIGLLLSILAGWGFIWFKDKVRNKYILTSAMALVIAGNYFWLIFDDRLREIVKGLFGVTY